VESYNIEYKIIKIITKCQNKNTHKIIKILNISIYKNKKVDKWVPLCCIVAVEYVIVMDVLYLNSKIEQRPQWRRTRMATGVNTS